MSLSEEPVKLTRKQVELLNWFRSEAPSLADAYEGAVRLVADDKLPGRIHFVAHVVRDISDRLVDILNSQVSGARVQYSNELNLIAKEWPKIEKIGEPDEGSLSPATISIDYGLAARIDSLVSAHRNRPTRQERNHSLFRCLMRSHPTQGDVNRRIIDEFAKTRNWFSDRAHLRNRITLSLDEHELPARFAKFEGILHSFVGDFFTGTEEIDAILHQANK